MVRYMQNLTLLKRRHHGKKILSSNLKETPKQHIFTLSKYIKYNLNIYKNISLQYTVFRDIF